jgi:hypothetical protein
MMVLNKRGIEYTRDMNMPVESKYWKFENDLGRINDLSIIMALHFL